MENVLLYRRRKGKEMKGGLKDDERKIRNENFIFRT